MAAVISRLIAKFGLPILKICISYDLRILFKPKGYQIKSEIDKFVTKVRVYFGASGLYKNKLYVPC
jgi:hypothetical protein